MNQDQIWAKNRELVGKIISLGDQLILVNKELSNLQRKCKHPKNQYLGPALITVEGSPRERISLCLDCGKQYVKERNK